MTRPTKRKVQWKAEELRVKALPPHPFVGNNLGEDKWRDHLVPGSLWTVKSPIGNDLRYRDCKQHEVPYLFPVGNVASSAVGQSAVYLGTVRVEEEVHVRGQAKTINPLRHCFLVMGARYLVLNVDWLRPST